MVKYWLSLWWSTKLWGRLHLSLKVELASEEFYKFKGVL